MVESSGAGGCRCACQEEFDAGTDSSESQSGCCSPQVFTSVLLGILSCVLMTGGVFLAFHRWDPMWLMVSGVGVILILIGTILHCCNNSSPQGPRRHSAGGKGCCARPPPPDHHHGHLVTNNGSLTEQLLPLSNARSVSQLSLNMLPGYFPPVVTAYGIEQHSAVVQNINRIVQQQQQQQLQQSPQPQSPGSVSPGVISAAGKSYILLSLAGDSTPANIQNLVAAVYQLDGNASNETTATEVSSIPASSVIAVKPPISLVLKNAEVQTCHVWPNAVVSTPVSVATDATSSVPLASSSSTVNERRDSQPDPPRSVPATVSGTTQTEDIPPAMADPINLMDCSPDITQICDNVPSACDSQSADHTAFANIPVPVLVDMSERSTSATVPEPSNSILLEIPEAASSGNLPTTSSSVLIDVACASNSVPPSNTSEPSEVLVDISECTSDPVNSNNTVPSVDSLLSSEVLPTEVGAETDSVAAQGTTRETSQGQIQNVPEFAVPSTSEGVNSELSSSISNLSAIDADVDDGEFMDPPPSYEDVTLEGESAVGAFGLAYGTI